MGTTIMHEDEDDVGAEDEGDEVAEPEEGDYTTEDHRRFFQYGKLAVEVDEDADWAEAVRAHMDAERFWPDVWWISDHGNAHRMLDCWDEGGDDATPAEIDEPDDGPDYPEFIRVGSGRTCSVCGKEYYEHRHSTEHLDYRDRPYLRVLCCGRLVKL